MREAAFIKENREKWERIDGETQNDISAKELADNFIELTDDLSYARTFYPKSNTERYLNQLTSKYFSQIYQHRRKEKGRFKRFWLFELPTIMYERRKYIVYSFILFVLSMGIGIFSMMKENTFAASIISQEYVNMTNDNIANNDPMAVYKQADSGSMFVGITINNIKVAFFAFIYGIFLSIGTAYILIYNGVMLGVFQAFFYKNGLLFMSSMAVWLHGTLEISAIIIAGGAGFVLGNSILFPGSYSRKVSLVKAAKDALKIVFGLIPVFIVAGFIESFLTRLTEMHIAIKLSIIIVSAAFILFYFFIYPFRLHKKTNISLSES
ncbi:MAG: stage II sporulation protein M [Dysgonomonas sp.]